MQIPDSFADRLRLAMKQANLSPAALGAAVGVDKSVVSRWISGRVRPTQHNLSRIATVLAQALPGFSVLTFEAPADAFRALLHPGIPVPPAAVTPPAAPTGDQCLPIPFNLLDAARRETARQGVEYFGVYRMYYWAFSEPGKIAQMALMLRPEAGLIEARYGAEGYAFHGWALLALNRTYVIFAEQRFEAMAFLVLNAGRQPKVRFVTGVLSGPADGLLVPTSSPVVLVRERDLLGDRDSDIARFQQDCDLNPIIAVEDLPPGVHAVLAQAVARPGPLLQVPYASGDEVDR